VESPRDSLDLHEEIGKQNFVVDYHDLITVNGPHKEYRKGMFCGKLIFFTNSLVNHFLG
jgi:hypothetical protein